MKNNNPYQVAIVGGGPVGLFLGCCLQQAGISCIILEKRAKAVTHSRSIGIHPVSLERFEEVGLAAPFIKAGIKIKKGLAFAGADHMGTLSFDSCPPPYNFILSVPQFKTEQLLAAHLHEKNPNILRRNTTVTDFTETADNVILKVKRGNEQQTISARYMVGCDGKESTVRQMASIPFTLKNYADTYMMGDFSDNTQWGSNAAIFLCKKGLIESFPLPEEKRRWVIKTPSYQADITRNDIEIAVEQRINHPLESAENYTLSSFGVQHGMAASMVKNRVALAGDAAHLVSPIGGQGMNLGWLDGYALARCFEDIFRFQESAEPLLQSYSKGQLKIAQKVTRRAELNMRLGRATSTILGKKLILNVMLIPPFSQLMARAFTMRGLKGYFF